MAASDAGWAAPRTRAAGAAGGGSVAAQVFKHNLKVRVSRGLSETKCPVDPVNRCALSPSPCA